MENNKHTIDFDSMDFSELSKGASSQNPEEKEKFDPNGMNFDINGPLSYDEPQTDTKNNVLSFVTAVLLFIPLSMLLFSILFQFCRYYQYGGYYESGGVSSYSLIQFLSVLINITLFITVFARVTKLFNINDKTAHIIYLVTVTLSFVDLYMPVMSIQSVFYIITLLTYLITGTIKAFRNSLSDVFKWIKIGSTAIGAIISIIFLFVYSSYYFYGSFAFLMIYSALIVNEFNCKNE